MLLFTRSGTIYNFCLSTKLRTLVSHSSASVLSFYSSNQSTNIKFIPFLYEWKWVGFIRTPQANWSICSVYWIFPQAGGKICESRSTRVAEKVHICFEIVPPCKYIHFYPSCQLNLGVASGECVGYNFERDSQNIFLFSWWLS